MKIKHSSIVNFKFLLFFFSSTYILILIQKKSYFDINSNVFLILCLFFLGRYFTKNSNLDFFTNIFFKIFTIIFFVISVVMYIYNQVPQINSDVSFLNSNYLTLSAPKQLINDELTVPKFDNSCRYSKENALKAMSNNGFLSENINLKVYPEKGFLNPSAIGLTKFKCWDRVVGATYSVNTTLQKNDVVDLYYHPYPKHEMVIISSALFILIFFSFRTTRDLEAKIKIRHFININIDLISNLIFISSGIILYKELFRKNTSIFYDMGMEFDQLNTFYGHLLNYSHELGSGLPSYFNFLVGRGGPYVNFQLQLYDPIKFLFFNFFENVNTAYSYVVICYLAIGFLGTYKLFIFLYKNKTIAIAASIIYISNPALLRWLPYQHTVITMMLLPWIVYFLIQNFNNLKNYLLVGIILGFMLLNSHPTNFLFISVVTLILFLSSRGSLYTKTKSFFCILIPSFFIGLPTLLTFFRNLNDWQRIQVTYKQTKYLSIDDILHSIATPEFINWQSNQTAEIFTTFLWPFIFLGFLFGTNRVSMVSRIIIIFFFIFSTNQQVNNLVIDLIPLWSNISDFQRIEYVIPLFLIILFFEGLIYFENSKYKKRIIFPISFYSLASIAYVGEYFNSSLYTPSEYLRYSAFQQIKFDNFYIYLLMTIITMVILLYLVNVKQLVLLTAVLCLISNIYLFPRVNAKFEDNIIPEYLSEIGNELKNHNNKNFIMTYCSPGVKTPFNLLASSTNTLWIDNYDSLISNAEKENYFSIFDKNNLFTNNYGLDQNYLMGGVIDKNSKNPSDLIGKLDKGILKDLGVGKILIPIYKNKEFALAYKEVDGSKINSACRSELRQAGFVRDFRSSNLAQNKIPYSYQNLLSLNNIQYFEIWENNKFEIVESKGKIDKVTAGSQKITITFKDKLDDKKLELKIDFHEQYEISGYKFSKEELKLSFFKGNRNNLIIDNVNGITRLEIKKKNDVLDPKFWILIVNLSIIVGLLYAKKQN